jgi:single-stranded DNA-binding protein
MWDVLAEIAARHVKKGERIFVTGRIEVKSYVKNDITYNIAKVVSRYPVSHLLEVIRMLSFCSFPRR